MNKRIASVILFFLQVIYSVIDPDKLRFPIRAGAGNSVVNYYSSGLSGFTSLDVNTSACLGTVASGNYQMTTVPQRLSSTLIIDQNNVTLDLGGYTLEPALSFNDSAIKIMPGCSNIVIRNGVLSGFKAAGIVAQGTDENRILNIRLENVTIINGVGKIIFENADFIHLKNVVVRSVDDSNNYAFYANKSSAICIDNCLFDNNFSKTGECAGLYFRMCKQIAVKNSSANYNVGALATYGLSLNSCFGCVIESCSTLCNTSVTENCYGLYVQGVVRGAINQLCTENNDVENSGMLSYGVCVVDSVGIIVRDSRASFSAYGFYDNEHNTFNNTLIHNFAQGNVILNYARPFANAPSFVKISSANLQESLQLSLLENISIEN